MDFAKPSLWVRFGLPLSIFLIFISSLNGQTTQQATLLKDINVGTASSNPTNFTSVGNTAYFTADDGSGSALWKSDGTAGGTTKITTIISNPLSYNGNLYYCTKFAQPNGYFQAVLWKYSGGVSTVVDTVNEYFFNILNIDLKTVNSSIAIDILFQYTANTGFNEYTLRFFSKGISGTTSRTSTALSSRYSGNWTYVEPYYLNDTIAYRYEGYFSFGQSGGSSIYLASKRDYVWRISSRPQNPYTEIYPLGIINNEFIYISLRLGNFAGYVGSQFDPYYYLYKMNNNGDTVRLIQPPIKPLRQPDQSFSLVNNRLVKSFNNKIYFNTDDNKIWETNGTASGTVALTDGTTTTLPLSMNNPIVLADGLYFYDSYNSEFRIWKIGTTGNISKILSIPTATDKDIKLVNLNNALWQFTSVNTNSTTDKPVYLYKIDVVNGTRQAISAANGLDYTNNNFVAAGLKLFASTNDVTAANSNPTGQELYQLSIDPSVANCANDNVAPYFGNCPTSIVKNITTDRDTTWYPFPSAFDNCSTPSITANITGFYANNAVQTGNTVIISKDSTARFEYTATDAKGNTAKCIFTVKILKPCVPATSTFTNTCPSDLTVLTPDACARITWQVPTALDNCGNIASITQTTGSPSGACFPIGVQTITYTKQYGGTCSFKITVNQTSVDPCATDVTPPVLTNCPTNVNLTTATTTALANWTAPTATDNCGTPSVSSNYNAGFAFPIGSTTVVYTATDAKNNTATCAFNIVVTAAQTGTPNCVSHSNAPWSEWIANVTLANLNNASDKTRSDRYATGYSDWTDKTATVSKGQNYPLSITPGLSWSGYQTNLFFRAWIDFNNNGIYEDTEKVLEQNNGNQSITQSITIPTTAITGTVRMRVSMKKDAYPTACETFAAGEVEDYTVNIQQVADPCATDVTPPVLTNCPANISLSTTTTTAVATWTAPTATDNCSTPSVSSNYNTGFAFPIGSTNVIYTATDAKNNSATCSFTVTVSSPNTGTCKKYTASSTNSICNPATWQPYILRNSTDRYVADGLEFKETSTGTATLKGTLRSPTWQAVAVDLTFSGKTTTGTPQKVNCLTPSLSTTNWAYYPTVSGTIALPTGTVNISTLTNDLQIGTGANTQNINDLGGYTKFSIGTTPFELSFSMTNETAVACDNTTDPCANDVTPPVFQTCPQNISVTTTGTTAIASWAVPIVTDNCTANISLSSNYTGGSFPIGTTTIIFTASDAKNNTATCSFNVTVSSSTTCTPLVPVKIFAKNITATTATLVWSKVSNAFQYEYQLLYDDTSQPNGGALISSGMVNDTFANISLVSGRLRAIVRSRCTANGTWSAWSNATMFNLFNEPCTQGARTAFVEDFESSSYSTPQGFNLPLCWTKLTYHAPNVYESWVDVRITSRGTLGNATKRAIMFRSTPLDSSLILMISPEIANLSAATNRLRFKAANTWGSELAGAGRIQIGTMSNIYDGSTFVSFGNPTVITDNNFREYMVDFTTYTGTNRFIAFKYLDAGGDQFRSLEIDDVVWETKPVTTASNDIELTITSTPATYRQWTTNTVRVTAKNIGTTTMTNIKIDLKRPAKMSFGGTRVPSVGTFNDYCAGGIECSEWLIPSLAAGATATLDAPFFVLDAVTPIMVTTNLLASTPTDATVANNTASVSIAPATSALQSASYKPTQLIPIVIQRIAPNPTDGELRILLESLDAREVTFEFYNSLGKVVKSEKKAVEKGLNRLEFSIYDFAQGVYFVTPSTHQGHKVPTKFVKL